MKFGSTDVRLRQEKRKEKKKEKKLKKNEAKQSLQEAELVEMTPQTVMLPSFEESFDDDFDYKSIQKTSVDEGIVIDYMTFAQ